MVQFARSAGCALIAEGVETEAEHETLLQLGVEYGQGYLYGRPSTFASRRPRCVDPRRTRTASSWRSAVPRRPPSPAPRPNFYGRGTRTVP